MRKVLYSVLCLMLTAIAALFLGIGSCVAALESSQPHFPNADLLVSAESVQNSLGTGIVVIDARSYGYETAHIPGAISIKYADYFEWGKGLLPVVKLNRMLGETGLTTGTTIVIYDNTSASFGAAGRLFWMLEYLGCSDVHMLDGGWDKWAADARPTETKVNILPATTFTAAVNKSIKATKAGIANKLEDAGFVTIDCRTDEEFIGWKLYGEARGGHIPGAVQIPYNWYFNADRTIRDVQYINALLLSRGVTKDKEIAAYCTVGIRSGFAYFILRLMGYKQAANYDASIVEWASDSALPMEEAPRYSVLVYPAWVKALIAYHAEGSKTDPPANYNYGRNHKYVILTAGRGRLPTSYPAYLSGHVPGAVYTETDIYENGGPSWFLKPVDEVQQVMGEAGITADTTVIVSGDIGISFGARLWWIFKYAGVKDVRLLNGGYQEWITAGYEGETTVNPQLPATTFAADPNHSYLATTYYVAKHADAIHIGDVRSYDEHIGAKSGYDYIVAKGRIPGAVWLTDGGSSTNYYRDTDSTISSYTQVRDLWIKSGILASKTAKKFTKEVAFHCGNGYRSSLTFLHAYLMGLNNMRNYSSGWYDWSTIFTEDPSCEGVSPGVCQSPSPRKIIIEAPSGY